MRGVIKEYLASILHTRQGLGLAVPPVRQQVQRWVAGHLRLVSAALALVLVGLIATVAALPGTTSASESSVLGNGSFERGFVSVPGCGAVGAGWSCFSNGGVVAVSFNDDQWDPVVADGDHSQLIEFSTVKLQMPSADRYAGLFQTVRVVKGAPYRLSISGMVRSTVLEGDPMRYRVEVGTLPGARSDWQAVENWTDTGWTGIHGREAPGWIESFQTVVVPDSEAMTLFVRVWKKWGVDDEIVTFNLDAIDLVGPAPSQGGQGHPVGPQSGGTGGPVNPDTYHDNSYGWGVEQPAPAAVCSGPELVYNGNFEGGFAATPLGHVGRGWAAFTNGGAANYGFYDDQWDIVVAEGESAQLIEINTKDMWPADADRYAGIYQKLDNLRPGGEYEFRLSGLLRGTGQTEDPYRFAAQWAISDNPDWRKVAAGDWHEMDLGPIYERTKPGGVGTHIARFTASDRQMFVFVRGWNKWALPDVEMDLNVDAISILGCVPGGQRPTGTGGPVVHGPGGQPGGGPVQPGGVPMCLYTVVAGDALGWIAQKFNVDVADLMTANDIYNPNLIFVGQELRIPGCQGQFIRQPAQPEVHTPVQPGPGPVRPGGANDVVYVVEEGDMLTAIAAFYGVNVYDLADYNGITDINFIYPGQEIRIPGSD
jgi:LysM repeat protein